MGFIYNGRWEPDANDLDERRDRAVRRARHDPEFAESATWAFLRLAGAGRPAPDEKKEEEDDGR